MRMRTILISIIVLCLVLAGCGTYDYSEGKEIPVSVEEKEDGVDDFKSEFEKLQQLIDEGEAVEADKETEDTLTEMITEEDEVGVVESIDEETTEELEPVVEEEVVEVVEEKTKEVAEETAAEEVVKEETTEEVEEEIPEGVTTIKVNEGELVNLAIESEDDDDDTITYTFTEPLNENGKWQTDFGDAGKYKVTITASDGELSTSQDIYIVVEEVSRAPVIEGFDDMTVDEGDIIELKPTVTDPEGGSLELEYSGWMTKSTKEIGYDDAGTYEVTLTATSSESGESTEKTISITVNEKNRPPKIISITNK